MRTLLIRIPLSIHSSARIFLQADRISALRRPRNMLR